MRGPFVVKEIYDRKACEMNGAIGTHAIGAATIGGRTSDTSAGSEAMTAMVNWLVLARRRGRR